MIRQGAVRIDGEKVSDTAIRLSPGEKVLLQVGKRRYARIEIIEE